MPEPHTYLALKLALELYRKPPAALDDAEKRRLDRVVLRQAEIERRILATPEAASVVLPASSTRQGMAEIQGRYASRDEFLADLEGSGCDEAALEAALTRDLRVEAVLDSVARAAAPVSDTEIEIFYLLHGERFKRPEQRTLRHILVTINDALPGSERPAARARVEDVRTRLLARPQDFAAEALRHSECPTAVDGGKLGTLPRGQLFPTVESAAFALEPGVVSAVVESPVGFHLLLCDAIEPADTVGIDAARARIREHLETTRRSELQKAWIRGLFRAG